MTSPIPDTAASPLTAFSDALAAIVESLGASTVGVRGRHRHGVASGVVWRPGVLVTAAHVFRRPPAALGVVLEGAREADATLAGIDSTTDIAVFRLADTSLPAARLGDAGGVKAGHLAIAVGRSVQGELTASHGIVNRTSGAWQTWLGGQVDRLIRLDGGVYEGLSGGPVADAGGAVIGIATAALSRSYGIVVPASTVSRVVDALLADGHVARPYLGIGAQPVALRQAGGDGFGEGDVGLLITAIVPGGPAATAGVRVGDVLASVDGQSAASLAGLRSALGGRIGATVAVSVLRGGQQVALSLTVAPWPAERRRC